MAQVINTNVMSLNAQRNLNTNSASLATTIQRLSSGLRINSARDDAAGLAISQRMTAQIRGMEQAIRNANDGISLAQTAEGALVEIGNNLQRIRELAVQSANATNSDSDRKALDAEVKQLVAEIDRVANQTNFNNTPLLDGSFKDVLFQVGANAGQTIGVDSIVDANADALGKVWFAGAVSGTVTSGAAISGLTINNVTIDDVPDTGVAADNAKALAKAINDKFDQTGVYAKVNGDKITLTSVKAGQDLEIGGTVDGTGLASGTTSADAAAAIKGLNILSFEDAQRAMEIVDAALTSVNTARADLGAIQNRFASAIANLQVSSENLQASRSRIQDADYAKETAELTRTQILQQAGTAMLAQAKAIPQSVLSLLQ